MRVRRPSAFVRSPASRSALTCGGTFAGGGDRRAALAGTGCGAAGRHAHCRQGERQRTLHPASAALLEPWGGALTAPPPPRRAQDNICTRGLQTTAGSRSLEGYLPPHDATAVARLRAAGAVIIGKTNMDEFGMGSSTENSAYQVGAVGGGWVGSAAAAGSSWWCSSWRSWWRAGAPRCWAVEIHTGTSHPCPAHR